MIEYKPIGRHTRWNHEPTRLCDGQPSDDYDILTGDMKSLCEAQAEATLCPTCRQNSNLHTFSFSFRPNRYRTGKRRPPIYTPSRCSTPSPPSGRLRPGVRPALGRRAMCRPTATVGYRVETGYDEGKTNRPVKHIGRVFLYTNPWNSFLLRCRIGNKSCVSNR